jgi:uncharacterized protein
VDDIQEQLAELRRRIARVDARYAGRRFAVGAGAESLGEAEGAQEAVAGNAVEDPRKPARYFVEDWLSGSEVRTELGAHFETEKLWESHRVHGSFEISTFHELPCDLLDALSAGAIPNCDFKRVAFLDTETTGLAGGAGTYAFLIGVGSINEQGFHLRQFFMREPGEEPSLLHRLTECLAEFDVLVTYNGRTYDQPLLESRYVMARAKPPFARLAHLDLLHGARRLWNLRFDSCRLVELEQQILGFERVGDLPGALIPYVYFEYLRSREASRVAPILHHNAHDILTLACLTAIVPQAFRSPHTARFAHGAEMVGIARWLVKAGKFEEAAVLLRRAVQKGLRDELLFRSLWDLAQLERKLERPDAWRTLMEDLTCERNAFQAAAYEELAKHAEHTEKEYGKALDHTQKALAIEHSAERQRRLERLRRKLEKAEVKKKSRSLL